MAEPEKQGPHRNVLFMSVRTKKIRIKVAIVILVSTCLASVSHGATAASDNLSPATPELTPTVKKAKLIYRIETKDPVVFITIDDGYDVNGSGLDLLEKWRWPVTSFLLPFNSKNNVSYFQNVGRINDMGTHTAKHTILKGLSLKKQQGAICEGERQIRQQFGYTSGIFRPPTGSWDETTLVAAANCGITTILMWRVSMNGSTMTTWGPPPRPGDVILIHYVNSLDKSLKRIAWELKKQGLRVARLSDYLPSRHMIAGR